MRRLREDCSRNNHQAYANGRALRLGTGGKEKGGDADIATEWTNEYMYALNVNNDYEFWVYGIKRFPNGAVDIDKHVVHEANPTP